MNLICDVENILISKRYSGRPNITLISFKMSFGTEFVSLNITYLTFESIIKLKSDADRLLFASQKQNRCVIFP